MRGKMGMGKIAAALLGGLAIFFVSCEKEVLRGTGEPVEVRFTLGGVDYGNGGTVMRSAGGGLGLAEETVVVPMDEDYCLYATLKEDETSSLRASTLTAGTLLRIVAFKGGVDQGSALYKVASDGTSLVPEGSATGLILPEDTYTFVAYSCNSTTVAPDYSYPVTDVTVSPEYDLLWGDAKNEDITGGGNVEITMYHKFSQVLVSVTSTAITPAVMVGGLTNFSVNPGYKAYLTVEDGTIANEGTVVSQSHTPSTWNGSGTQTASSATGCIVYTAGEQPLSVTIGSVTLGSVTYPDAPAKFNMSLELGKSYTLAVSFKRNLVWAGSNVYWQAASGGQAPGYLTFDAPGSGDGSQKKQGVFFKWGSLVGMTPAGTEYSTLFDIARPVYTPTFTSPTVKSWSNVNPYTTWDDIPFVDDWVLGDRYNTHLNDDARNTGNNYAYWKDKKGDICRYISENGYGPGGNYRMPTSYEMGARRYLDYYEYEGWRKYPTSTWVDFYGTTTDDGQTEVNVYAYYGSYIFPASGYRRGDGGRNGRIYSIGYAGEYLSCSARWSNANGDFSNTQAYLMQITTTQVQPNQSGSRSNWAYSIRCVQNN